MGTSTTTELEPLVNARTLAELLSISERKVLRDAAEGLIPSIRVGRRSIRFRPSDVLRALEGGDAA